MRKDSPTSALRRLGFADPGRASKLLDGRIDEWEPILDELGNGADPDLGLLTLLRLTEASPHAMQTLLNSETIRRSVCAIAAMTSALGDMLITHPEWIDDLGDKVDISPDGTVFLEALDVKEGSSPSDVVAGVRWEDGVARLRTLYYRQLISIAARDLTSKNPVAEYRRVSESISDLVDGCLKGALALARSVVPGSENVCLTIIAMGKTGARELNYISDVDVVYVGELADATGVSGTEMTSDVERVSEEEALEIATKLANAVSQAVSGPGAVMPLWPLDANLRPEGKDGPLVRTLASHVAYYERWAKDWEFQALLKARPAAGDEELGRAYVDAVATFVWSASQREGFVESSRQMRTRVESNIASQDAARQIKLGAGGLRDVEFTVQLLQLVHGRVDTSLRVRNTLDALAALRDGGYVARTDADELEGYYRFLRTLEHRIQLQKMRRSHVLPTQTDQLRRIARAMKIDRVATGEDLEKEWKKVRGAVRSLHKAIYYRPLLPAAARLRDDDISLDREAAADRLAGIGYRDPARAIDHISALTEGVSRTAKIQRQLLPVLLGWFAEGPEPDSGLLHFRILSETMGRTHWYMKLLRDSGMAARRLAHILSTSRYLAEAIPALPESVRWLEGNEELKPLSGTALRQELDALISRRKTHEGVAMAGRYLRRRILLRTGLGLVLGVIDTREAQASITMGAEIAVDAALRAATAKVLAGHDLDEAPSRYLVVGLGSFGAHEMSYGSDADILFVHEPLSDDKVFAQKIAVEIATTLIAVLKDGAEEPPLKIDADLRPEGRNGPLARSLESYEEYYDRWLETWERQALLIARPVAGDEELGESFIDLIDPIRFGEPLSPGEHRDVRRMKARIESERAPRGVEKTRHLKLGPGGISDVDWTVQYLQLDHGGSNPSLRTTSTLDGLVAATEAGLLSHGDADRLADAWLFAQHLRLAIVLGTGRTSGPRIDTVPTDSTELATIAALLSRDHEARQEVGETYLRLSRRARSVVERIFFGDDE